MFIFFYLRAWHFLELQDFAFTQESICHLKSNRSCNTWFLTYIPRTWFIIILFIREGKLKAYKKGRRERMKKANLAYKEFEPSLYCCRKHVTISTIVNMLLFFNSLTPLHVAIGFVVVLCSVKFTAFFRLVMSFFENFNRSD